MFCFKNSANKWLKVSSRVILFTEFAMLTKPYTSMIMNEKNRIAKNSASKAVVMQATLYGICLLTQSSNSERISLY